MALTLAAITVMHNTQCELRQQAHLAHTLVTERVAALEQVDPGHYTGQYPLPVEQYGCEGRDRYYEDVSLNYGLDGGIDVYFSGFWNEWSEDRDSLKRMDAEIRVPAWAVIPGGEVRYRAETADLVAAARAKEDALRARIAALTEDAMKQAQALSEAGASEEAAKAAFMHVAFGGILDMAVEPDPVAPAVVALGATAVTDPAAGTA